MKITFYDESMNYKTIENVKYFNVYAADDLIILHFDDPTKNFIEVKLSNVKKIEN